MKLLKVSELKKNYQISDEKLCLFLLEGIPTFKIGETVRFPETEVGEWLQCRQHKQETLEAEFVDSKGRRIEDYLTRKQLSETLRISEKEIINLTLEGMPCTRIGSVPYYSEDDVLAYFRVKKKAQPKNNNTSKELQVIAVDGSYKAQGKQVAAGLVWKSTIKTVGRAYSSQHNSNHSGFSEWLAVLEALQLVEQEGLENVVIATDQKGHINYLNKKELPYPKSAKKESSYTEVIDKINILLKKLDKKVVFRYAKETPYTSLYNQAHKLSQLHKNQVFDPLPSKL